MSPARSDSIPSQIRHACPQPLSCRDAIELAACVFGPISVLAQFAWPAKPLQFGKWDKVAMWLGSDVWICVGAMLTVQIRSVQLSRSARTLFSESNLDQSLDKARASADLWRKNYFARNLSAKILNQQGKQSEAIKELSSFISGVDPSLAYEPAPVAAWLAERYDERAELYEATGQAQEAAADREAAVKLRHVRFDDFFGYQLESPQD